MNNRMDPRKLPPQAQPAGQTPAGGELFVGLNILSKIGVIFIILGVIAFAAVSEGYLPPLARTILIFAVSAVMAGAGELFYRTRSAVFARALTLGAIAEAAVSVLISYYALGSIGAIAALGIGAAIALGGLMLAWRYGSGTIAAAALICGFLPFFAAADTKAGLFSSLTYLLVIQSAAVVVAVHKKWTALVPIGMTCGFVSAIAMLIFGSELMSGFPTAVMTSLYALLFCAVYSARPLLNAAKNGGKMPAADRAVLLVSQSSAIFITFVSMTLFAERASAGAALFMLAALYLGSGIAFAALVGQRAPAVVCLDNLFLSAATIGVFTAFSADYAYMALHLLAAAVMVWGILSDRLMIKVWGYVLLSCSEWFFLTYCLFAQSGVFMWQFTLNAAVWLGLMIFCAARKKEGALLAVYTAAAMLNLGAYASYMLSEKLMGLLIRTGTVIYGTQWLYSAAFCAAAWLLLGFVSGKLRHMKKGAAWLALALYAIGLFCLFGANVYNARAAENTLLAVILTVALNIVSVLAVLDMALKIKSLAPRFARAVGLSVSAYGLYALTFTLGSNKWVVFASCIISIIYLAMAALWIIFGFRRGNALLRRFGLALALLSAAKLFLFDFGGLDAVGRTLMFIGFGLTLLCISFAYGIVSKKMKNK